MPTVVIAAGGTAGHVVPALAVADELRASGAEVVWVGTRERAEAQLVPAAGYPIEFLSVRGPRPPQPGARAGRGGARRRGGRRPRAACSRASAPTRCSAAAATSPGPVGLAAVARRTPLVLTRGRQPPRPREPHAGAVRAARVPGVPDRGPRGRALSRHGPPGAARGARGRPRRARASGSASRRSAVRARVRRQHRRAVA